MFGRGRGYGRWLPNEQLHAGMKENETNRQVDNVLEAFMFSAILYQELTSRLSLPSPGQATRDDAVIFNVETPSPGEPLSINGHPAESNRTVNIRTVKNKIIIRVFPIMSLFDLYNLSSFVQQPEFKRGYCAPNLTSKLITQHKPHSVNPAVSRHRATSLRCGRGGVRTG